MMIDIYIEKRMTGIILVVKHTDGIGRTSRGHVSSGEGSQP